HADEEQDHVQAGKLDKVPDVEHSKRKEKRNAGQGEGQAELPIKQRTADKPGKNGGREHLLPRKTGQRRYQRDQPHDPYVPDGLLHVAVTWRVTATSSC